MFSCVGFAAEDPTKPLVPYTFERRDPGPNDVAIEILYCGVCHSDLHTARNEWPDTLYPCVPGHEIVGRVTAVGDRGDALQGRRPRRGRLPGRFLPHLPELPRGARAVLRERLHRHLQRPATRARRPHLRRLFRATSWSTESFVLRVPDNLDLAAAAPLLCAGITTYSPLRHWKVGAGQEGRRRRPRRARPHGRQARPCHGRARRRCSPPRRARSPTARASAPTRSCCRPTRRRWRRARRRFDLIIDTVAAPHDINPYLDLLEARRHAGAGRRAGQAAAGQRRSA